MVQKDSVMNYDSIIILGPTATGKTKISIELAKLLDTEIVNADSMYIYKFLDIGTAKPTLDEMQNIKHHLIGFVEPDAAFNVSLYRTNAIKAIDDICAKNKTPIKSGFLSIGSSLLVILDLVELLVMAISNARIILLVSLGCSLLADSGSIFDSLLCKYSLPNLFNSSSSLHRIDSSFDVSP